MDARSPLPIARSVLTQSEEYYADRWAVTALQLSPSDRQTKGVCHAPAGGSLLAGLRADSPAGYVRHGAASSPTRPRCAPAQAQLARSIPRRNANRRALPILAAIVLLL